MGASRSAATWPAILASMTAVGMGWAFFGVALTTDLFSADGDDAPAIVVRAASPGEGDPIATIDVAALEGHLAAVDERLSILEAAQEGSASEVPGGSGDSASLEQVAALEARVAAADAGIAEVDEQVAAIAERVRALEDDAESSDRSTSAADVPAHEHLATPVATFPHVWTRTGNTLPEDFLPVHLTGGVWHFEFEAACLGDLSSCPRPGDRPPELLVRDLVDDPFGEPWRIESGTDWCETVEADRELDWRLWMANVRGVTWSLTIGRGDCPDTDGFAPSRVN